MSFVSCIGMELLWESRDMNSFYLACLNDPLDDTVKLVFADYLEEQGDDFGMFIRTVVARRNADRRTRVTTMNDHIKANVHRHLVNRPGGFINNRAYARLDSRVHIRVPARGGTHRYTYYPFGMTTVIGTRYLGGDGVEDDTVVIPSQTLVLYNGNDEGEFRLYGVRVEPPEHIWDVLFRCALLNQLMPRHLRPWHGY